MDYYCLFPYDEVCCDEECLDKIKVECSYYKWKLKTQGNPLTLHDIINKGDYLNGAKTKEQ